MNSSLSPEQTTVIICLIILAVTAFLIGLRILDYKIEVTKIIGEKESQAHQIESLVEPLNRTVDLLEQALTIIKNKDERK